MYHRLSMVKLRQCQYQQLSRQHPQEHSQRIDRGVSQRRGIAGCQVRGIGQCRWIGVSSGQHTYQRIVVQLPEIAPHESCHQQRNDRDDGPIANPHIAAFVDKGIDESLSCTQPHAGQEKAIPISRIIRLALIVV